MQIDVPSLFNRIRSYARSVILDKSLIYGTHQRSRLRSGDIVCDINFWQHNSLLTTYYQSENIPHLIGKTGLSCLYVYDPDGLLIYQQKLICNDRIVTIDFSKLAIFFPGIFYGTFIHFVSLSDIASNPPNYFPHYSGYTTFKSCNGSLAVYHGSHGYLRFRHSQYRESFVSLTQILNSTQTFLSCAFKYSGQKISCLLLNSAPTSLEFNISVGDCRLEPFCVPSMGARIIPLPHTLEGQISLTSRSTFIRPLILVYNSDGTLIECFHV